MDTVIADSEKFVIKFLNENLDKKFLYHNLTHTQNVVKKTKELIEGMNVGKKEADRLLIAAWFHDVGFVNGQTDHEEASAKIASEFLRDKQVADDDIVAISKLILATKMTSEPETETEKIIRDADCAHIGSKEFSDLTELLKKEWEFNENKRFSELDWLQENIDFLTKNHRFHTDFASANWQKTKGKNLAQLLKRQKKLKQETTKLSHKKDELEFKKHKVALPERGIETMFRVALRNHITLSDIADTKANILLSVNAIIISVALSNLLPKLDNPSNYYLIYPTLIFLLSTVASIVLSVLATRPNVTKGKFSKQDVADKKVNLLFFGNFHQMKLDDFEWAMGEMMKDRDYLYSSLTKDLYFLGLVLNRKYSLLRTTYTVFLIGMVISVVAFAVAFQMAEGSVI